MNTELLDINKNYVIGVSGGSDSMFLFDSLRREGYKLFVAHVNYNFREDTEIDYHLVKDYCDKYDISFHYKQFFEEDYCKGNFQDNARTLRYDFYKEIYDLHHCDAVISGHHLDDHLESIYMQLEKHNVVHYLGIKEENIINGMRVVRPLMHEYKETILKQCKEKGIPFHDDYTNFETDFERDKVRNTILNQYSREQKEELLLKANRHNKRIKKLEEEVKPYYRQYGEEKQINYFSIPNHLRDLFLYLILLDSMPPRLISSKLIEEMRRQVESIHPNIRMNLPVNYMFIKEYDNVYIVDKDEEKAYSYEFHDVSPFACEHFCLLETGHMNEGVYLDESDFPITIRTQKPGDTIVTSSGTKKLSRLFINAKVPTLKRKSWPVVVRHDGTVILVPNIAKNIDYLTTKPNVFVIKYDNQFKER